MQEPKCSGGTKCSSKNIKVLKSFYFKVVHIKDYKTFIRLNRLAFVMFVFLLKLILIIVHIFLWVWKGLTFVMFVEQKLIFTNGELFQGIFFFTIGEYLCFFWVLYYFTLLQIGLNHCLNSFAAFCYVFSCSNGSMVNSFALFIHYMCSLHCLFTCMIILFRDTVLTAML